MLIFFKLVEVVKYFNKYFSVFEKKIFNNRHKFKKIRNACFCRNSNLNSNKLIGRTFILLKIYLDLHNFKSL